MSSPEGLGGFSNNNISTNQKTSANTARASDNENDGFLFASEQTETKPQPNNFWGTLKNPFVPKSNSLTDQTVTPQESLANIKSEQLGQKKFISTLEDNIEKNKALAGDTFDPKVKLESAQKAEKYQAMIQQYKEQQSHLSTVEIKFQQAYGKKLSRDNSFWDSQSFQPSSDQEFPTAKKEEDTDTLLSPEIPNKKFVPNNFTI